MKYKDQDLGDTPEEIAKNMVKTMQENMFEIYLNMAHDNGLATLELCNDVLEEIQKIKNKDQANTTDLMKSLMGGVVDLEVVKTETGRPYKVIARKGQSKLLVNISLEVVPYVDEKGQKVAAMGVGFRSMEIPNQVSGVSVFDGFQGREIEGDKTQSLRHKRYEMPVTLMPCQDYDFYRQYVGQDVTAQVRQWIKDKVQNAGAEMLASDSLLTMMIEEPIQGLRTECPVKFKTASESEAKA